MARKPREPRGFGQPSRQRRNYPRGLAEELVSDRRGLAAAERGVIELSQWTAGLRDAMRAADGHNSLMSLLRHVARTEDGTLFFVHAGIAGPRPLAEPGDAFWWGVRDFGDMAAPYMDYRRVVRGFGGPLLAACFGADGEPVDNLQA